MKARRNLRVRIIVFILLFIMSVFFIMPYFWMLSNSFKGTKELLLDPKHILPEQPTISGYVTVLTKSPFMTWFRNSVIVTVTDTAVILFTSSIVGYVFSKFEFKWKTVLFGMLLATMMVPAQTTMIPRFLLIDQLGMYNSLTALIIPSFMSVFGIFLCKQFCDGIPRDLLDAAKLDGAGEFRIYLQIVIPQIKPAIGALGIFTFLEYWNDYLTPLIMLNDIEKMTLPLALSFFQNQHVSDLSAILAASALIMIPVTIVFMAFQKYFIKGIAMTGMK
jgi:multiple sugar transport system permease protein